MNVTELRTGNLVTQDGELINGVNSLTIHKFDIKNIILEPIPITEALLLKFGFKNYNYIKGLKDFEEVGTGYLLNELLLTYFDANHSLTGEGYFCVSKNEINMLNMLPLKYIHELQNLYFALTNEELTCKQ